MFEFIYGTRKVDNLASCIARQYKKQSKIVPLLWTEHCIECSAPACYATCKRYRRRSDGNCIRIKNGIYPVEKGGRIGAMVEFRTWAKIESQLKIRPLNADEYARVYKYTTILGESFRKMASLCPIQFLQKIINQGWFSYRQKYINYLSRNRQPVYQLNLRGITDNHDKETKLLVDIKTDSNLLFREVVDIPLGESEFRINLPPFEDSRIVYFINIHPVNPQEHVTIHFEYLELEPTEITEGKKVKCVIWDLDNTLWKGTLIENKQVSVNQDFVKLIKYLDSCGIVNSIVSKNNEEEAVAKLKEFGLEEYFVFKKINWNPKSVNIENTLKQMNISPDTVVFVDDNPFERNEVLLRLPSLTTIDPGKFLEFTKSNRFKVVISEDSRKRRETYKMMEALTIEEEQWNGSIDDFLRSCDIRLQISSPTEENLVRCYELLQRTNQLNSSGRRLSLDEVKKIVLSEEYDSFVLTSQDKFGDYGIVGFLIVDRQEEIFTITDFVISCRVANKKIEPTLINYLAYKYHGKVLFNYKRTNRNGPMYQVIQELNMRKETEGQVYEVYSHSYDNSYSQIVRITEKW